MVTSTPTLPDTSGAFLSPREVRLGDGELMQLGTLLRSWDVVDGPVYVVCDKVVRDLGHAARAVRSLEASGYGAALFSEIAGEPDAATATAAVRGVRDGRFVAVVGLGGGSAMDLAKIAAALATGPGDVLDYVGAGKVRTERLPLVLVPTTAGTGAEATRIAMISHGGEKAIINDPHLVPDGVILDPELVATLPPAVTASTGLDALSHGIESLLSTGATALSARMSEEAIRLLAESLPRAFHDPSNREARRATLYGAYLGGLSLNAGVVLGHSIAYTIANRRGVPHGVSAGMALPYCVAYAAPAARQQLERVAGCAGLERADTASITGWLTDMSAAMDVPLSLHSLDLTPADAVEMAAECVEKYPRPTNPVPLDRGALEALYGYLQQGDIASCVVHMEELASTLVPSQGGPARA